MSPEEQREILRLLQGDAASVDLGLAKLYMGMGKEFLRHYVWRGLSPEDAQDVLQDTVVKIAGAANRVHSTEGAGAWFWRIAKNCFVDHCRKRNKAPTTYYDSEDLAGDEENDYQPTDSRRIDADQLPYTEDLGSAVSAYTPNRKAERCVSSVLNGRFRQEMPDRAYVLLQWVEGASVRQLADFLGRSEDATKTFLYECRKKAKAYLQPCFDLLNAKE